MNTPSNAGKELLPCPFCGGAPRMTGVYFEYDDPSPRLKVTCDECDVSQQASMTHWDYRTVSKEEAERHLIHHATKEWNRRTTPPTQSQEGETPKGEWGIEEFGNKLWVGPMRRDGKLNEVVCIFDLEDLKPEAEIRKRQLANIIVQCVNNAGPQSNAIRDAENHADAAQRENARLRSEVAVLKADAEKYRRRGTLIGRILHRAYETKSYKDKGHVCDNRQTVESIVQMIEAHLDDMRARAATEEGKRG